MREAEKLLLSGFSCKPLSKQKTEEHWYLYDLVVDGLLDE